MRLGAPVFLETTDPAQLVRAHQQLQLTAAYCPEISDDTLAEETKQAFAEADIVLAEVGAYCINILDSDAALRRQNIDRLCQRLEYAEQMGARCCVMHGGSIETGGWGASHAGNISREALEQTVSTVQHIIDTVKPQTAKLTLEMTAWTLPYSVDTYQEILSRVDRQAFGVHLDPFNILDSPVACYRNEEIVTQCIRQLSSHIVSCHAKDIVLKAVYLPIEITETTPGKGVLNYAVYLSELARLPEDVTLMIEHLGPEDLAAAIDYILRTAAEAGVAFHAAKR